MQLIDINKKFGDETIFENFSYDFQKGKITVVIGDSGVGKTTLLNIILGLTRYDGDVRKFGKMSCVFQNNNLIPTLTVKENLELVCKDIDALKELEKFEILEAKDYYPSMLSNGMAKRVEIIRALHFSSDIILMDEPFSCLDYYMKYKVVDEIKKHNRKHKSTIIIVTHDLKIVEALADRILILKSLNKHVELVNDGKNIEDDILKILVKK